MTMDGNKTGLVILNGRRPSRKLIMRFWNQTDFRICVDGAAATLLDYLLTPDIILGDLDSVSPSTIKAFPNTPILKNPDQSTTDGEKALRFCLENKFNQVHILGALGKRSDHWLYNIGLLNTRKFKELDLTLYSDTEELRLIRKRGEFYEKVGTTISLMPVYGSVAHVTTTGLRYAITDGTLEIGGISSISNEFSEPTATITFPEGELLVLINRTPASN